MEDDVRSIIHVLRTLQGTGNRAGRGSDALVDWALDALLVVYEECDFGEARLLNVLVIKWLQALLEALMTPLYYCLRHP